MAPSCNRRDISITVVGPGIDPNGIALTQFPWPRLTLGLVGRVPRGSGIPNKDVSVIASTVQLEGSVIEGTAIDSVVVTLQDFNDGVVLRVQNVDSGVNGKEDEVAPSAKLDPCLARVSRCGEAGPQILSGEGVPHTEFSVFPVGDNVEAVGGER